MSVEAEPLKLGILRIRPHADVKTTFSDNIFIESNNEDADLFTTINPGVSIEAGQTEALHLSLNYNTGFSFFSQHTNQDNISHGLSLGAGGEWNRFSATATMGLSISSDANTLIGDRVQASNLSTGLGANYKLTDKVGVGANWGHSFNLFDDDPYMENESNSWVGNVNYQLTQKVSVFVDGGYNMTEVERSNDSDGYTLGLGVNGQLTPKLGANMRVGYGHTEVENTTVESDNFVASGNVNYALSTKTSLNLGLSRSIEVSVTEGNNLFVNTSLNANLAHKFYDKWSGTLSFAYNNTDFENPIATAAGDIERNDDLFFGGMGVVYTFKPWMRFYMNYHHRANESNIPGLSFNENAVTLGVGASF
ncbi:MAG: outer membrane beta-barrel protein [Verrucomicrobiota bacterium]|nr:outer membrane beta-barrel protein [Verrucomicrobiota bacterium]